MTSAGDAYPVNPYSRCFINERAVYREGIQLFTVADTVELLEYLDEHQIGILGVDGFQLVGDGIRPDQELDFDFGKISIQEIIKKIAHLDDSHRFEFTAPGEPFRYGWGNKK